jgi:hypothetical protein
MVSTRVPGHHRPTPQQAIKVPVIAVQHVSGRNRGRISNRFKAAAKARGWSGTQNPPRLRSGPGGARFNGSGGPGPPGRSRLRQLAATIRKIGFASGNLGDGSYVDQPPTASLGAKSEMPTFYSSHDFSLIMLHDRRAGPISVFR